MNKEIQIVAAHVNPNGTLKFKESSRMEPDTEVTLIAYPHPTGYRAPTQEERDNNTKPRGYLHREFKAQAEWKEGRNREWSWSDRRMYSVPVKNRERLALECRLTLAQAEITKIKKELEEIK